MDDRFRPLLDATRRSVLDGPGRTPQTLRAAMAAGAAPPELQPLVDKIRREPWAVTDTDWAALRAGHDEDAQFELVVSTVLGAAGDRLAAALAALEGA